MKYNNIPNSQYKLNMAKSIEEMSKLFNKIDTLKKIANFPKKQIIQFCANGCPPLKDVLKAFSDTLIKYQSDHEYFKDVVILLYLSLLKGSSALLDYSLDFMFQFISYKAMLICIQKGKVIIVEIYCYIEELLNLLVPALLTNNYEEKIMSTIEKLNKVKEPVNLIFQGFLISKIKEHLETESQLEFDEWLKTIYERGKFNIIKQLSIPNGYPVRLQFYQLAFLRNFDDHYSIFDIFLNGPQSSKQESSKKVENWVLQSFTSFPQPIDTSKVSSLKIHQLYNFLKSLQIYGSSPKIQVLNDYLQNQEFLDIFCQFLLGQNLADGKYSYGNSEWRNVIDYCCRQIQKLPNHYQKIVAKEVERKIK